MRVRGVARTVPALFWRSSAPSLLCYPPSAPSGICASSLFSDCQKFLFHCVGRRQILTVSIFSLFLKFRFIPPPPFLSRSSLPCSSCLSLPPSPPSPRVFFSLSIRNNVCGIISRPRPALLQEPCLYCQVSGGRRRWWPWGPATRSPEVDKPCRRGDIVCVCVFSPHLLLPVGDGSPRQLGLSPSSSSSL